MLFHGPTEIQVFTTLTYTMENLMAGVAGPENSGSQALVNAMIYTRNSLNSCTAITTSSSELASIITRLQTQSQNFNVCSQHTAEMLQRSAWTSAKTQQFLNMVEELDKVALQKLADDLYSTVQQTKSDILTLVEELRGSILLSTRSPQMSPA